MRKVISQVIAFFHRTVVWILLAATFISFSCREGGVPSVISDSPRYKEGTYVTLEKLYRIDVTDINLFTRRNDYRGCYDFDAANNLYLLDTFEGTITVFDEQGRFLRRFGRGGQGPNEFIDANFMIIKQNRLYIYQGFHELKVLTLEGEFIKKHVVQLVQQNPLVEKAVGDKFYLVGGKTDHTFTQLELILGETDDKFSWKKEIWRYKYPEGLNGYPCWEWLFILDNGEFLFPENNHHEYSITWFDRSGEPRLKFGRRYKQQKYSLEARQRFLNQWAEAIKKGKMKVFDEPPVVRRMFQDERGNIWVVVGETFEDNLNPAFKNTVDIFNRKGEWLFSFKTEKVSKNIFYRRGKIYKVSPLEPDTYNLYIDVYKIKYLKN